MAPTVVAGESVEVDRAAYSKAPPARWDSVVFRSPVVEEQLWMGRVVGLPGEETVLSESGLSIDGQPATLPASLNHLKYASPLSSQEWPGAPRPITYPLRLQEGQYFVLGDNVASALDSRFWGGLDRDRIIGKVVAVNQGTAAPE